jgi:nanoRNase/pAp phosphatase (c-di-AMP/oligoRNAs hydrolase)
MRDGYGATSTILTEYLMDIRLRPDTKIATALFYGIMAETQDLGREASDPDMAATHFLYPHTNKRRLAKIENARVPREYFGAFRQAIQSAMIYERAIVSVLGLIRYPDMVAEMADFLLRLDEVDWAAAIGKYEDFLYVSLRTTNRDVNAGEILQRVLGSDHAGGHDMIAGGRIALPRGADWEEVAARLRGRLVAAVGMAQAKPVRLCS